MSDSVPPLHEQIRTLNQLPELEEGLLEPISVPQMSWNAFATRAGVSTRDASYMRQQVGDLHPKSMRQLVYMLYQLFTRDDFLGSTVKWVWIALLLNSTGEKVRVAFQNYKRFLAGDVKPEGRPKTLSEEQLTILFNAIDEHYKQKRPMTSHDIQLFIYEMWNTTVSKRFVKRLVSERPELVQATAVPMELLRAEVMKEELERFYAQFSELVVGVDPRNIINVDEVGFSRKHSMRPVACVVPAYAEGDRIEYVPQSDADKTFTMMAAITLSGEALKPMIVCPVKTLPREFLSTQIWNGFDCVLAHSESGFANRSCVCAWYDDILRPYLGRSRFALGDEKAPALLLCDGFRAHDDAEFKAKAAADGVRIIFIQPHSSHLTQPLDKFAFANLKRSHQQARVTCVAERNGKKIRRMMMSFYQTFTRFTIRASWEAVGIRASWDETGRVLGVSVNGSPIVSSHPDMQGATRKRVPLPDHFVNREQLHNVEMGRCPHCGRANTQEQTTEQQIPRLVLRLRLRKRQ